MITSYKQLTGKYLKSNMRRTILTMVGIILSVALTSSIGFFFEGLQQAQVTNMKNMYGSFHLMFLNPEPSLITKLKNNPQVSKSGLLTLGSEIPLTRNINLLPYSGNDQALELMPYKLRTGRYPEATNEVALEEWALRYINKDIKVNDSLTLADHEYTLVGILENQAQSQLNQKGILLTHNNTITASSMYVVEISPKANLAKALAEIKALAPPKTVVENSYLLIMLGVGEGRKQMLGLYLVVYFIIGIVVVATIAVIYNSFQISVVERVKQFGLLRTIGGTPKQIRKLVFREASVLAAISIPLGIILGIIAILGISVVFSVLVDDSSSLMQTAITPMVMLISIGLGIVSIYTSAYIPALYAGRISPLAAVSSRALITKEKIKRRKSWFFSRFFGFEGELASKNIRRNKKRYRITVFSITISVVLFITFASFIDMSLNINENANDSSNIDFAIIRSSNDQGVSIDESIIEQIESVSTVKQIYRVFNPITLPAKISAKNEISELHDMTGLYTEDEANSEQTRITANINIYDLPSLEVAKKYLASGNIDLDRLAKENGVVIINKNKLRNPTTDKTYIGPVVNLKVGDEIQLFSIANSATQVSTANEGQGQTVKVLAILSDDPFNFKGSQKGLKIITSEAVAKNLLGVNGLDTVNLHMIIDDDKHENVTKDVLENIIKDNPDLQVVNLIYSNRQGKSIAIIVKFLLYGFVIVVSAISCVNIINTITTNIILRKREFATIKSIGLTQKGLRKMVILEGLLYGIQGSIWGALIGSIFSYLIYKGLIYAREFLWSIPWYPIIIATIVSLSIGYISVLTPLARIKKENLIDSVREDY